MKENVKFEISGFKEAIEAMSKTQEAFKNLGKAIEQFNNVQPSKGVKLKRLLCGWTWKPITKQYYKLVCGFMAGNFIYQIIVWEFNWRQAIERSYFELAMALVIHYFILRKVNAQST